MKYPLPTLNALNDGAVLDLRFRIALQILSAPGFADACWSRNQHPFEVSLLQAEHFVDQAEKRGWIDPLPADNDLPAPERAHVERQASAQVFAQLHGQRVAQMEQSRVVPVAGRVLNG